MKTIMDVLVRNDVTRKGKRGVTQIFDKRMRRIMFMQRYFDKDGVFPSYRDIAKRYYLGKKVRKEEVDDLGQIVREAEVVDHYVSHECVRQTLSHQFDTILSTSENYVLIDKIVDTVSASDALLVDEIIQGLNAILPGVQWPQNPHAIVDLINSLINVFYPDQGPRLTVFMLSGDKCVIIRDTSNAKELISNLNRFIVSLTKKINKHGFISWDEITGLAREKGVVSSTIINKCIGCLDSLVRKAETDIWFAKNPSNSNLFRQMNLIASFYYHNHKDAISFEYLFSQLIRTFQFRDTDRELALFMLMLGNVYDAATHSVKHLSSYTDVIDQLSVTERKVVKKTKSKNIKTFTFKTLESLFHQSGNDDISFNSLRVYMTYSPIFKQVTDVEHSEDNGIMRLTLI
jgi:hypothetical protein